MINYFKFHVYFLYTHTAAWLFFSTSFFLLTSLSILLFPLSLTFLFCSSCLSLYKYATNYFDMTGRSPKMARSSCAVSVSTCSSLLATKRTWCSCYLIISRARYSEECTICYTASSTTFSLAGPNGFWMLFYWSNSYPKCPISRGSMPHSHTMRSASVVAYCKSFAALVEMSLKKNYYVVYPPNLPITFYLTRYSVEMKMFCGNRCVTPVRCRPRGSMVVFSTGSVNFKNQFSTTNPASW